MNTLDLPEQIFTQFKQVEHDYIGYQSLTDVPKVIDCEEVLQKCDVMSYMQYPIKCKI